MELFCRRLGVLLASAAEVLIRKAEAVVSTGRVAQRTVFGLSATTFTAVVACLACTLGVFELREEAFTERRREALLHLNQD
jgi:hypothetical protein